MTTRRTLALAAAAVACAAAAVASPASAARITIASDPEVVSYEQGHTSVFARGSDDALWFNSWTNSENRWSGWQSLGGHLAHDTKPSAISWKPGHMQVFVRSVDNHLWSRTIQAWPNTDYNRFTNWIWTDWAQAPNDTVAFVGSPKATSWGDGQVTVHVRGTDNAQYSRSYSSAFGGWGNWEYRGGCTTDDIEAISWGSGRIDTFTRGCDRRVYGTWFGAPGWSGIARIGTWEINGPPAVTTWGTNSLELFYKGLDGSLGFSRFNPGMCGGGWCGITNLGGTVAGRTVNAVSRYPGHTAVYALGAGGNAIWDKWWVNGGWNNWWQVTGNEAASPGAVAATGKWGTERQNVYWRTQAGRIDERWWHSALGWSGIGAIGGSDDAVPISDGSNMRYGIGSDINPLGYRNDTKYWGQDDSPFTDSSFRTLGTKVFRLTAPWNMLLPGGNDCPNTEDIDRVDRIVNEATDPASGNPQELLLTITFAGRERGNKPPTDSTSCAYRPTKAEYDAAVRLIVAKYKTKVAYWGPANELNYGDAWLGIDPDVGGPKRASEYYAAMRSILTSVGATGTVVGPDFSDAHPESNPQIQVDSDHPGESRLQTWVTMYRNEISARKAAGQLASTDDGFGAAAQFHPYGDVHWRVDWETRDYLNRLPVNKPVWFSEVATYKNRLQDGQQIWGTPTSDLLHGARADWLTGVLMPRYPQVKRVYWWELRSPHDYQWINGVLQVPDWDTALVDSNGNRRSAWYSYCRRIKSDPTTC